MPYDIADFKSAFGYKSGVVGKLVGVMEAQLEKDTDNAELATLLDAVRLQNELLEKDAKRAKLAAKDTPNFLDNIASRGLEEEIRELKQNPMLENAEPQLKMLDELYAAEQQLASATGFMRQIVQGRIEKIKSIANLPDDFTTRIDEDESTTARPSLEEMLRGGGELEVDKVYTGSNGKSYKVEKAISGGGHSAFKMVDEESGREFLWKPAANSMMLEAEVGASKLSSRLIPSLCPACESVSIDGTIGTSQPFVKDAEELGDVTTLTETQQDQMVAHMLTDWLISNHDNHVKQFMTDADGNLIGIDKGQAFKHFKHGEVESAVVKRARGNAEDARSNTGLRDRHLADIEPEDLDPDYFPRGNIGMSASRDFMRSMASSMREPDYTTGVVGDTVANAKSLTIGEVRELFGEYAKEAFPGEEEAFLAAVLDRAHNMDKQLANLSFSAPESAKRHTEAVAEVLTDDGFVKGSYPTIAKEIEPLRKAIMALDKVAGIEEAKDPDPKFALRQQRDKLKEDYVQLAKIDDDCKACEKYLSSDYRRVSPLLAAFEVAKVNPAVHSDPEYSYDSIATKLLADWKRIAVERTLADEDGAARWDRPAMDDTYGIIRSMGRVWEALPEPVIPNDQVVRGDISEHLFKNYPQLDPAENGLEDGEHNVNISLTWPGVMSTTIGNPMQHNFISEKTFIWSFEAQTPCPGRVIGDINPGEQEVTFPVGVKVQITKLIVRQEDKTLKSGDFGGNAIVIALAKLG